jgi:ankyrin repeat protein
LKYLKRANKESSKYEEFQNYYIPRKLKRFTQIDGKILDKTKSDQKKTKKELSIVHSKEEFQEKCSSESSKIKSIHYLQAQEGKKSHLLLWKKSNGPISDLDEFILKQEEFCFLIEQNQILDHGENILIISAEPGMGKSTILDTFSQCTDEFFFLKIVLNNFPEILSDLKENKIKLKDHDVIDFTIERLLGKKDQLEIKLLKHLAQEKKLILMFDGLDEVIDYKDQVKSLIKAIHKRYNLKKIFLTTRNHLRAELEDYFKTISFNLNMFEKKDQIEFLYNYWRGGFELNEDKRIKKFAEDLIVKMKISLTAEISELIGIPLQTKMLADIYFGQLKSQLNSGENENNLNSKIEINNIAELYNEFVETKIKIRFKEKRQIRIEGNRDLYESEKKKFYSDHIQLSLKILFKKNTQTSLDLDKEEILKYGVVVAYTTNKTPTFLHRSFAEFFLAKSSLQKIQQNKDTEIDKELEEIFRDKSHFLVRKFLNNFIKEQEFFFKHSFFTDFEEQESIYKEFFIENFQKEMEICCRENLLFLLKYFIEQKGANLNSKNNQCLIIASENGHREIVVYLLEQGIDVNHQDEDEKTALMKASNGGRHKEIVRLLLQNKNLTTINKNDNLFGYTALIAVSLEGHTEMVKFLLGHKDIDVNKQDKYGRTALWYASSKGHTEIVKIFLENRNINVNQQDKYGINALMKATSSEKKEIVQLLLRNKDINVNQQDEYGRTALMWASLLGYKEIVQMLENKLT